MPVPTKKTVDAYRGILQKLLDAKTLITAKVFNKEAFEKTLAELRTSYGDLDGYSISGTDLDQLPDLLERSIPQFGNETMKREFAQIVQRAIEYVQNSIPTMQEAAKGLVERMKPELFEDED